MFSSGKGSFRIVHTARGVTSDAGAAIVELAIVIPILLLLLFGIVQIGHSLAQVTWILNASYSTAMVGAGTPQLHRPQAMQEKGEAFLAIVDPKFKLQDHVITAGSSNILWGSYVSKVVSVAISGRIVDMLSWFGDNDMRQEIVAPVVTLDSTGVAANLLEWGNATQGNYYNCSGASLNAPAGASTCLPSGTSDLF